MYKKSDLAKLEQILKYTDDIDTIQKKHGTPELTLSDLEGEYAIMMCIIQIGEAVNKIENYDIVSKLPASKITGLRNRIVHGYEDVDRKMIANVIKIHIPELKLVVKEIIRLSLE